MMMMIYKYAMLCDDDDLQVRHDDVLHVCHVSHNVMLCIGVSLL